MKRLPMQSNLSQIVSFALTLIVVSMLVIAFMTVSSQG